VAGGSGASQLAACFFAHLSIAGNRSALIQTSDSLPEVGWMSGKDLGRKRDWAVSVNKQIQG
jgi:hypothetical protein